jgi:hypothetical protein
MIARPIIINYFQKNTEYIKLSRLLPVFLQPDIGRTYLLKVSYLQNKDLFLSNLLEICFYIFS